MNETSRREIEHESRLAALERWYAKEQDKLERAGVCLWRLRAAKADAILLGREKTSQD